MQFLTKLLERPWKATFSAPQLFNASRVGARGRADYPDYDSESLLGWHRRSELAFTCIRKIAETSLDPELLVETRRRPEDTWERDSSHPMSRLFMEPNPDLDGSAFLYAWLSMLHISGKFSALIYRNSDGLPIAMYPVLPPARLIPLVSERSAAPPLAYEYQDGSYRSTIRAEDVFIDTFFDPEQRNAGLSPLAVALGSIDMDSAQTEYVRAFFNAGGVPSGIIRVLNKTLTQPESDSILMRWLAKYNRASGLRAAPAVLDQNAEYQRIGANLDELASEALRDQAEARICGVFGVPPLLAGCLVGLKHQNNRASAKAAQAEFWDNKMSPLFKRLRVVLTWRLLKEFTGKDQIKAGLVRLSWDMSQVAALQEDVDAIHKRANESLAAGGITLNEYREIIGKSALEEERGEVFYISNKVTVIPKAELGAPPPPPQQLPGINLPLLTPADEEEEDQFTQ